MLDKLFNPHNNKELRRGEILYTEQDKPKQVYLVQSGLLGLFHISEKGKETFLRIFSPGQLMGHRSVLAQENYHASCVAISKSTVYYLAYDQFLEMVQSNKELNTYLLEQLSKDLGTVELRFADIQDKNVIQRISETLIYLKLRFPDHVWTRKEIAEYAASTFETVARVMTELENNELIIKSGRDFSITNLDHLLDYISK